MSSPLMIDILSLTTSYNSIIMLSFIPLLGIVTKLAFRKWGQNYYEHIVMNAYLWSVYTIVNSVIIYPILFFLKTDANLFFQISSLSILSIPLIMSWFFKGFYKDKSLKSIFAKVLLIILLSLLGFIILIILVMIAGFIFAIIKGPEALEYIQPQ